MISYPTFLTTQGLKNTTQRQALFELIFSKKSHFTIADILQDIHSTHPRIGFATVYRMIKLLSDLGFLDEHHFAEKAVYEVHHDQAHHDHIICTKCQKVTEFSCPEIETLQEKIITQHNFTLTHHRHELYGVCAECQKKAKPEMKK